MAIILLAVTACSSESYESVSEEIDALLAKPVPISADDKARMTSLREEAEKLHRDGKTADALNALSKEHREALLGSVDEALEYYVKNYDENTTGKYKQALKDEGLATVNFTPEQTTKLNQLSASVREDWVKQHAGQFDAQALFDFTAKLFAE